MLPCGGMYSCNKTVECSTEYKHNLHQRLKDTCTNHGTLTIIFIILLLFTSLKEKKMFKTKMSIG